MFLLLKVIECKTLRSIYSIRLVFHDVITPSKIVLDT